MSQCFSNIWITQDGTTITKMTDCYYDALRASGEYPRKGYGYLSEKEKIEEITRKVNTGWRLPWVSKEAARLKIEVPE